MGESRPDRPDADLVVDALLGARDPLAELLRRHWDTALSLSTRVLGSADLARDAVQEAAIAAMTDLGRLRSPDRFGAWFCGIALNVSRRWLRQARSEVPTPTSADRPSDSLGPAEAAELADLAAHVRGAVDRLPGGQRDAVLLFYLQGLSHREVAAELGISAGAVKARLHQARAGLAPRLATIIEREEKPMSTSAARAPEWVEVEVSEIRRTPGERVLDRKHIMILTERGGERLLPMWIGPAEATAMAVTLEAAETPRPFTYRLAAGLVEAAGAAIAEVRVTRLEATLFYASVLVRGAAGEREVDSRPSDAVNLALATGAPILVNAGLLGADLQACCAGELAECSVVTAELAAEAREHMLAALKETRDR